MQSHYHYMHQSKQLTVLVSDIRSEFEHLSDGAILIKCHPKCFNPVDDTDEVGTQSYDVIRVLIDRHKTASGKCISNYPAIFCMVELNSPTRAIKFYQAENSRIISHAFLYVYSLLLLTGMYVMYEIILLLQIN